MRTRPGPAVMNEIRLSRVAAKSAVAAGAAIAVVLAVLGGKAGGTAFLALAHDRCSPASATDAQTGFALAEEAPFLAENAAAMTKMMNDMEVKPTGDVDRDFVAMMAPHHQGAINMAIAVLRHGRNPQIKRLAQEIIVTQQEEIAAMRLAVGEPLPPLAASPTQPARPTADSKSSHAHHSMTPAGADMK